MKHFRFCVEPAGVVGVAHGPGETWSRFQDAFEKGPGVGMKHPKTQPWGPAPTFGASSSSFPKFPPSPPWLWGGNLGLRQYKDAGWRMEGGFIWASCLLPTHRQSWRWVLAFPPSQNQSTIIAWSGGDDDFKSLMPKATFITHGTARSHPNTAMPVSTLSYGSVTAGFSAELWEGSVVYQITGRDGKINMSHQRLLAVWLI